MLKKQRAKFIQERLEELYPNPAIPLLHKDSYTLLVAVLLSAQCTDERVNKVTPALFDLADDPASMARLSIEAIDNAVRSCGLSPRKAKAISEMSQILELEHGGQVPADMETLETFPGVGHKTASVVMSQAFGVPSFPVDTHIHRLAQRWGLTSGKNVRQTEEDLKSLFPEDSWNKLHLQIIYYGREYCSSRGCNGTICEICKICFPDRRKPFLHKKS
ncbi:MAG: endonuclease III [Opitutae bacterium]|jgi:endonuclease III|nr:endonuclease III [Opitutae bacterium]MBT4223157.1 endonuclease III [Opitutae bacterium]MBT5378195.1 endonuclease III [Opitutae bacterium]MBT6461061.1 endonuclease III [Opitutae bacterium]MBT7854910.1 endonuclease III [Opitutae bacterium]